METQTAVNNIMFFSVTAGNGKLPKRVNFAMLMERPTYIVACTIRGWTWALPGRKQNRFNEFIGVNW